MFPGAIVESKPQLFGLPEHVRTDQSKARESRSLKTAGMPSPDDAAKLLGSVWCILCIAFSIHLLSSPANLLV